MSSHTSKPFHVDTLTTKSVMFPYVEFKNAQGNWYTNSLFFETAPVDKSNVIFTWKEHDMDDEGYISFPKLYRSLCEQDPTEVSMCEVIFGEWTLWEAITKTSKIKHRVAQLRLEVSVKVRSNAIKYMANEVATEGKNALACAKILLAKGWVEQPTSKIKDPKLKAAQRVEDHKGEKMLRDNLNEDAKRLGISLN